MNLLRTEAECLSTDGKGNIRQGRQSATINSRFSHRTGQPITELHYQRKALRKHKTGTPTNIPNKKTSFHLINIANNPLLCLILLELVLHPYNCHLTCWAHCIVHTTGWSLCILINDTLNAHTDHITLKQFNKQCILTQFTRIYANYLRVQYS